MGANNHPIFRTYSPKDISLLSSDSIVEDTSILYYYPVFQEANHILSLRQHMLTKEMSLFEELLVSDSISEELIFRFFKLGVIILGLSLKTFPEYVDLSFVQRRGVSKFFMHYVLQEDYSEFKVSDIERIQHSIFKPCVEGAAVIGGVKWATKNLAERRNGKQEAFLLVNDLNSWADAASQGLPACCSYAFLSEFDNILGIYYNWYAVEDLAAKPPVGWRVPTKDDYIHLLKTVDKYGLSLKRDDQIERNRKGTNRSGFAALAGGYIYSDGGGFDYFGSNGCIWSSSQDDNDKNRSYCLFISPDDNGVSIATQDKGLGFNVRLIRETATDSILGIGDKEKSVPDRQASKAYFSAKSNDSHALEFSWGDAVFSNPSTLSIFVCWFGSVINQFVLDRYDSSGWWGLAVAALMILSLGLIFSGSGYIINRFLKNIDKNDLWGVMSVTLAPVVFSIYAIPIVAIAVLFDWTWMLGIIGTIGEWATTTWKLALYTNIVAWLVFGQYAGKHFRRYLKENHLILATIVGCITVVIAILGIVTN